MDIKKTKKRSYHYMKYEDAKECLETHDLLLPEGWNEENYSERFRNYRESQFNKKGDRVGPAHTKIPYRYANGDLVKVPSSFHSIATGNSKNLNDGQRREMLQKLSETMKVLLPRGEPLSNNKEEKAIDTIFQDVLGDEYIFKHLLEFRIMDFAFSNKEDYQECSEQLYAYGQVATSYKDGIQLNFSKKVKEIINYLTLGGAMLFIHMQMDKVTRLWFIAPTEGNIEYLKSFHSQEVRFTYTTSGKLKEDSLGKYFKQYQYEMDTDKEKFKLDFKKFYLEAQTHSLFYLNRDNSQIASIDQQHENTGFLIIYNALKDFYNIITENYTATDYILTSREDITKCLRVQAKLAGRVGTKIFYMFGNERAIKKGLDYSKTNDILIVQYSTGKQYVYDSVLIFHSTKFPFGKGTFSTNKYVDSTCDLTTISGQEKMQSILSSFIENKMRDI